MSRDLDRFKSIYFDEFKETLSDEDAERNARSLLNLYVAVYGSVLDTVKDCA